MTTGKAAAATESIELSPSYTIPFVLIGAACLIFLVQRWVSVAIALFGFFLLFQAATIRLRFTDVDLEVYRSEKLIRSFPYADWLTWQIFWSAVPVLFYFKEVKSIHFLPILFNPSQLQACLEQHCPGKQA